jgi:predicted dehydrogenase
MAAASYEHLLDRIDAAIVAVPHHLHADVAIDLLNAGVHVLVEKPLAPTAASCLRVIAAARHTGAVLAVGLMRRFLTRLRWVKAALDTGALGTVQSFEIHEGFVYRWPVTTGSMFRKDMAGGGVLADTGAHTLDLVHWWFGTPASIAYRDDSHGGVEADCTIAMAFPHGVTGAIELSRTRDLSNTAIVRGTRGEIEVRLDDTALESLRASPGDLLQFAAGGVTGARLPVQRFREIFVRQIEDWLRAIQTGTRPAVTGEDAVASVALIEQCYQQRQQLQYPWEQVAEMPAEIPA